MRYTIDTSPHVGAKYRGLDREFEITGLPVVEDDQWVEYYNINTKQTYSCRLEAFLDRFSPTPD
jgi:hypothetical protein